MLVVSAQFLLSGDLLEHIALRRRSFASAVVPSLIVARVNDDPEFRLYLEFHDHRVLASKDPIFLARFDDGFELLILQEELLDSLKGSIVGIKNGALSIGYPRAT
jgi:hypothetical protein